MHLSMDDFVEFIREKEIINEPKYRQLVDIIKNGISAFVNKRRNIFTVLKIDIHDRRNINNFNRNFFIT